MPKRSRQPLPAAQHALSILGAQIAARRRELRWTAAELAERVGTTPALISRIERGAPGTAIGTVFEAATIVGVPLFGIDDADPQALGSLAEQQRLRLALLPARTRTRTVTLDDDF